MQLALTLSKLKKSKNIFQAWFPAVARSSHLTGIKCGFPAEETSKSKNEGSTVILFHSLEIATTACFFLFFSLYFSLMGRESYGACDAFASSLAHVSLNARPVPPRGIPKFPTVCSLDWKGSHSCLVILGVVSSTGNLLISSCWQCCESPTWRRNQENQSRGRGRLMSRRNWTFMDLH